MPNPDPARGDVATVTFVLGHLERDWHDIERLDEGDIERSPHRFQGGRNSWIAQGYLRLRAGLERRGLRVRVSASLPTAGIALVHRDDANRIRPSCAGAFLLVVRADRAPVAACDVAIAQNGTALRENERFVPLWPQPALHPRDAGRGTRIARLAYHGRPGRLPDWLAGRAFLDALAARGVAFEARSGRWGDYRETDLAIAARDDSPSMLATKPATKIYNAWLAGVPVLAKAEPAYREIRRSPLDFLEIAAPGDVLGAIDQLRAAPERYEAMVANGRSRAREFDVEAIRGRWLDLFDREILPAARRAQARSASARRILYLGAMVAQKSLGRAFKARVAIERWRLDSPWDPARLLADVGSQVSAFLLREPPGARRAAGGPMR